MVKVQGFDFAMKIHDIAPKNLEIKKKITCIHVDTIIRCDVSSIARLEQGIDYNTHVHCK